MDEFGGGSPREGESKKRRGFCMQCLGKIWRLKDDKSAAEFDQEQFVKQTFKELIIYLVFLTFVCIISFSMASDDMYYYTKVILALFVQSKTDDKGNGNSETSFEEITTVADFWSYALGPLLNGLYWSKWYNSAGTNLRNKDKGLIYYENFLMGAPRLRQLRVASNSCKVNPEFDNFITDCFAEYTEAAEDDNPFGNKGANPNNNSDANTVAWNYQSELEGYRYWGKLGHYPERGYAINLTRDKATTKNIIDDLKDQLWIRRGARAVFIDFTTYNANINLFCVVRLSVEFPATGGAFPKYSLQTVKLIRYFTQTDMIVFGCEICFLVFIAYYLVEEVIEIADVGCRYFFDFWNLLDAALILVALICTGLNVYRHNMIKEKLKNLDEDLVKKHISFSYLGFIEARFNNCVAILVFFAWVKVFKYISFNKTMTQLSTTLSRCAKDLLGFFIMFAIVFIAFTQLGYLLFGTQVKDFSTFLDSFFTLFRIILGDFDFHQLEQANRILGPMFFMLFVFFVFFVLINMFLAIINDTYSEVKSDMAKQVDVFIMSDYIKQTYNKFMDRMTTAKEKLENFEKILKTDGTEQRMSFEEWKTQLMQQGFEEEEIQAVFNKYDIDGDRSLDPTEQKKMLEELERQAKEEMASGKKDLRDDLDEDELPKENVSVDDFMALTRRVDRMEGTMGGIIANIDAVLAQLASLKF